MVARVDNVLPLNVIHTVVDVVDLVNVDLDGCNNVMQNIVVGWLRQWTGCGREAATRSPHPVTLL